MIEEKIKKVSVGAKQFEVRQEIFFEPQMRDVRYRIDTYLFSPVSLQVNSQNYKPTDCLRLFKNYIRLRAPTVALEDISIGSEPESRLIRALRYYEDDTAWENETVLMSATKLFALTLRRSMRLRVRRLLAQDKISLGDVEAFLNATHQALLCYRQQLPSLRVVAEKLKIQCDRFCDEYMSINTLFYYQRLINRVDNPQLKAKLQTAWDEEFAYHRVHHPESIVEGENGEEQTLYRWRLLIRYVGSYLYLNIKSHNGPSMLVHSLYGIAAAVSMIFATLIAFVWQDQYGALSTNLFLALVIGYIFKDRIKEMLREKLAKKFRRWIPDRRLEILRDDLYHVGDCKESFEFFEEKHLPAAVRAMRQNAQSVKGIYDWRFENILLYKKEMTISTDSSLFQDTRYALLDTTWFNISPFLDFIDASNDELPVANPQSMAVSKAEKIYHLYFVRRLIKIGDLGEEILKDEIIRVVVNHAGIKSVRLIED